ncbi:Piwi-domain-containing protein [Aureobasidium pullulans]|nr:Piwi-domain-containing protein [Aureobasidium pullulans]
MRRASMSLHTTTINTPALACANFSNAHHQICMRKHRATFSGALRCPYRWQTLSSATPDSTGTPTLLVIDQEVAAMKKAFAKIDTLLVIIASKRHHVRFFPQRGVDKNANPLPGTLVETGVTQPFENDFYLCAHTAIKGTARPVHYNVLLNEPQWPQDKSHTLIYEHSYQYIPEFHRGGRQRHRPPSVSLFPAVYYAHIASLRGAHHSKSFGNPAAYDNTVSNTTDPVYEPLHHQHAFRSSYLL